MASENAADAAATTSAITPGNLRDIVSAEFAEVEEKLVAAHARVLALITEQNVPASVRDEVTGPTSPVEARITITGPEVFNEAERHGARSSDLPQHASEGQESEGSEPKRSHSATRRSLDSADSVQSEFFNAHSNSSVWSSNGDPNRSSSMGSRALLGSNFGSKAQVARQFDLVKVWKKNRGRSVASAVPIEEEGRRVVNISVRNAVHMHMMNFQAEDDAGLLDDTKTWIIKPGSMKRVIWDVFSIFLVGYDMVYLPLLMFEIEENAFATFMSWCCRLFWTFDIIASFLTGHIRRDGGVVMQPKKIAFNYVITWFLLDIFIVLSDWLDYLLINRNQAYARMGKVTRSIRMVRLLRLLKISSQFNLLLERFNNEYVLLVISIAKILFVMLAFAHLLGCLWYGLSRSQDGDGWVVAYAYDKRSITLRYMAAMHWSVSQFTGGMDEFVPHNLAERLFAILAFLMAFILSCLFVSSITSSMTQLNILASTESLKLRQLRRYLLRNSIPNHLAMRVQRSAEQSLVSMQKFMPESEVGALRYVSEPLLMEVHFVLFSGLLAVHTFFDRYITQCPHVMKQVCHLAMNVGQVYAGDVLFFPGETPVKPKMYIVCSGMMQYTSIASRRHLLREDQWCSEANLWVDFTHQGELKAMCDCRICTIDARMFQEISGTYEQLDLDPSQYASVFVKNLNQMVAEEPGEAALDLMPPPDLDEEVLSPPGATSFFGGLGGRAVRPSGRARQSAMRPMLHWLSKHGSGSEPVAPEPDAQDSASSQPAQPKGKSAGILAIPGPRSSRISSRQEFDGVGDAGLREVEGLGRNVG